MLDAFIVKYAKDKKKLNVFGVESKTACLWLGARDEAEEQQWVEAIDKAMETTDNAELAKRRLDDMFKAAAAKEEASNSQIRLKSGTMLIQRSTNFLRASPQRSRVSERDQVDLSAQAALAKALPMPLPKQRSKNELEAAAKAKRVPSLPPGNRARASASAPAPAINVAAQDALDALDALESAMARLCGGGNGFMRERAPHARDLVLAQKRLRAAIDTLDDDTARQDCNDLQKCVVGVVTHMKQVIAERGGEKIPDDEATAALSAHFADSNVAVATLRGSLSL